MGPLYRKAVLYYRSESCSVVRRDLVDRLEGLITRIEATFAILGAGPTMCAFFYRALIAVQGLLPDCLHNPLVSACRARKLGGC